MQVLCSSSCSCSECGTTTCQPRTAAAWSRASGTQSSVLAATGPGKTSASVSEFLRGSPGRGRLRGQQRRATEREQKKGDAATTTNCGGAYAGRWPPSRRHRLPRSVPAPDQRPGPGFAVPAAVPQRRVEARTDTGSVAWGGRQTKRARRAGCRDDVRRGAGN